MENCSEDPATHVQAGHDLRRQRKWPQAAAAYQKAADLYRARGDRSSQAAAVASRGAVYWEQAQVLKAAACLEESLQVLEEIPGTPGRGIVQALLGLTRWRQGDRAQALALLGETLRHFQPEAPEPWRPLREAMENAAALLENRLTREETSGNPQRALQAHLALAPIYLCLENKESAAFHLRRAEPLARELGDPEGLVPALAGLAAG